METQKPEIVKTEKVKPKRTGCIILGLIVFLLFVLSVAAQIRSYYYTPANHSKQTIETPPTQTPTQAPTANTSDKKTKPKSSGSASSNNSDPAPTTPPSSTTVSYLDFYLDIANSSIGEFEPRETKRWTRNIIYTAGRPGVFPAEYNQCLNWFVADFNSNSGGIRLINDANQPAMQIRIEMVTRAEILQMHGNYLPFTSPGDDGHGNMTGAIIYIPIDSDYGNEEKCWSLKHEMMHAVGFPGHSNRLGESEMGSPIMMYWGGLKPNDQRAIRMLYTSGVPLDSTRDQVRAYFATHPY